MYFFITAHPGTTILTLPQTTVVDQTTRSDDPVICSGNVGYPANGRELVVEVRLFSESVFRTLSIGVNRTDANSCNEQKLSVTGLSLDETYHNASFRCSLFENQTRYVPRVSSAEEILVLLPGRCRQKHLKLMFKPFRWQSLLVG